MLYHLYQYGGIISYILTLFSIVSLGIFIEKVIYYKTKEKKLKVNFLKEIRAFIENGDMENIKKTITIFHNSNSKIAEIILDEYRVCSINGCNYDYLEEKSREFAIELYIKLEKNVWLISFIAGLSTMLGLFGTITGMITSFESIAISGNPKLLAAGIYGALFTTAGGLAVAMPSFFFHSYISKTNGEIITRVEKTAIEIINILRKRG
jgi:biopolymer transport protein ExbB